MAVLLALALALAAEPQAASGVEVPKTAAAGQYVEFGRGVELTRPGDPFALTLRGRLQIRGTLAGQPDPEPPDLLFEVRRARLVLLGEARDVPISLYIQLGVGPSDLETDREVPLRDGTVLWEPSRDLSFRFGQMKVPFSRQRMVSSSALQFVDRSIVNAELNLDRDIGVQWFSNDLFGLDGLLMVQAGVYNGDGRNRPSTGTDLLFVGRLQVQPFGGFDDVFVEADLSREKRLRASIGAAYGRNHGARRARSTHGATFDTRTDLEHGAVDALIKWRGWALQSEWIARRALRTDAPDLTDAPGSGWGGMVQLGHLLESRWELAGRFATLDGLDGATEALPAFTEVQLGIGHYLARHDLKVQSDFGLGWTPSETPTPTVRVQAQVFF